MLSICLCGLVQGSLFNDSFLCIFGGQTIEEEIFKISGEVLCAPVIQDGAARHTFAVPEIEETSTPTTAPSVVVDNGVESTVAESTDSIPTLRPTRRPSAGPTGSPSARPTTADNRTEGHSAEDVVVEENVPENEFFDEFEEDTNSNADVIYGVVFGVIVVVVCIAVFVIYRARRNKGTSRARVGIVREEAVQNNNFVVANLGVYCLRGVCR